MKKHVTKIICATVAAVVATGVAAAAGCSTYNKGVSLKYTSSEVSATSNGGFAVEKDGYIYFINSPENNTANNDYGTPVRGSIMRISVDNLNNGNYNSAETLVPQIAYTTNYQTGLFVYGDYIYYGTPSTKRNSDGAIQNDKLEMKSTKLDGSESMKDAYVTFPSAAYDYRFVEVDGVVYLMYVATSETLYDESTGVTNLHSYNTKDGTDTLLAYNITNYMFDAEDKTNPRVYYTMQVMDYLQGQPYGYNQVYTVTADETERNEYDFDSIINWDDENDRYINCGDLVFDGIGKDGLEATGTPFNHDPEGVEVNDDEYTYTLKTYVNNTLFYTRSEALAPENNLFSLKDSALTDNWNPVKGNDDAVVIMDDGTNANLYRYIFNGDKLEAVLYAEGVDGITVNYANEDGKLSENGKFNNDYYRLRTGGSATILHVDGSYVYYSFSGGNGYRIYRIDYTGAWGDYEGYPVDDEKTPYDEVRILDIDARSAWYLPEFIGDYILFSSETDNMSAYNYVMAFNLKLADMNGDGVVENKEIEELNELYNGVIGTDGKIGKYASDTDKYPTDIYANLANAARYMFYTADIDYVTELAKACNAELEEGDDPVYSENTLNMLKDFLNAEGDWAEYKEYSRKVNGENIYANRRDYYYGVISKMTDEQAESYAEDFKTDYLKSWPEEEPQPTWYEGLSTVERVFFIIGMCLAGVLVIVCATVVIVRIVRKKRGKKLPSYTKRRIKVDTTDDKNINVYEDESAENKDNQ